MSSTPSNFDPAMLSRPAAAPKVRSERLFVQVESFDTPNDDFHFAVGHLIDNPQQQVRVRLNSVAERQADRPKDSAEKIKALYVSGDNTRDTLLEKSKNDIKLLSFDDAKVLSRGEDGVATYRAHWPKTMSTEPEAEPIWGFAHVRLREPVEREGKRINAQAYVELLKGSAVVNKDSIDEALARSLSIEDDQGRARDPLVIVRVFHDGKQVAAPRLYPETERVKVFDQSLGEHKEVPRKLDADVTIANLMSGAGGRDDFETRQKDTIRAIVAGIKGQEPPKIVTADPAVQAQITNLYRGAAQGALTVEVVSAEKIDFGADSRKTYVADRERPQLAAYTIVEERGDKVQQTPGFTETMIAVHRHADGEPYAVFASPADMFPRMLKMVDLPIGAAPEMALTTGPRADAQAVAETPAAETAATLAVETEDSRYDEPAPF
jgi:hypothetical protein